MNFGKKNPTSNQQVTRNHDARNDTLALMKT